MSELKVNKVTPSTGTQVEIEATSILLDGTVTTATVTNATGVAVQHNGNTKLATTSTGVTVTGTLTAGNFTGNGSGLTNVTATGVGGSSSAGSLSIVSDNANSGTAGNDIVLITGTAERGRIYRSSGDVRFNTDTLCVDAANQRVGIETASPAYTLDVSGTARSTGSIVGTGGMTVDTDVLVVDAANNRVGVNKAAPSTALDVTGTVTATALTVGSGLMTAGQIQFPETVNLSTNANTLDDYREGTWTPVYQSSANATTFITSTGHNVQVGTYTKIGSLVFVQGRIRTSPAAFSGALATDDIYIGGLPFTVLDYPTASVSVATGFVASGNWPTTGYGYTGTNRIVLMRATGSADTVSIKVSNMNTTTTGNYVWFSMTYRTSQ